MVETSFTRKQMTLCFVCAGLSVVVVSGPFFSVVVHSLRCCLVTKTCFGVVLGSEEDEAHDPACGEKKRESWRRDVCLLVLRLGCTCLRIFFSFT